ncbi:hypothetical protein [Gracilimonas amylolytica]|uniref:hypothetical protein n=1 Tax=Gracilimonas amylolytica TaxID=1749045 RepID=UPI000CD91481|nr:hypothetical protein [Gracilimonas amylolytica]
MGSNRKYLLEYWLDLRIHEKEELEKGVARKLQRFDVEYEIDQSNKFYVLTIKGGKNDVNACYERFNVYKEGAFRARDELGDELRKEAYNILSDIETELRNFISKAMIEVVGFNWWDRLIPDKLKERAEEIAKSSNKKEEELHHPVEFTMFSGLIEIVTGKFTQWPKNKSLTVSDLEELLLKKNSMDELRIDLAEKSKTVSIWDDVFSKYFDDQKTWIELEDELTDRVIPIRNKVMHHRLLRIYEVKELKKHRTKLLGVLGNAKPKLPARSISDAMKSISTVFENIKVQINSDLANALAFQVSTEFQESMQLFRDSQSQAFKELFESTNIGNLKFGNKGITNDSDSVDDDNEEE